MRGRVFSLFFAAGLISLLVMIGCSGDKGGGPVTPKAQAPANQYEFYFAGYPDYWELYKCFIGEGNLPVRVPLPVDSSYLRSLALSADGSAILLAIEPPGQPDWNNPGSNYFYRFLALDPVTLDTLAIHENIGTAIEVSPKGKYVAVYGNNNGKINILDGSTFALLFSIPLNVESLRFTRDDGKFYYTPPGSHYGIYDLEKREIDTFVIYTTSYGYESSIDIVQPSNDEKYVYIQTHYRGWPLLEIYDQVKDSIIAVSPFGLKRDFHGDMRLSPDGRFIVWTDPQGEVIESDGTNLTTIIDARNGEIMAILDPPQGDHDCDNTIRGFGPGPFVFTADNHYTIFAAGLGSGYAVMNNTSFTWEYFDITGCNGIGCKRIACSQ